MTSRAQEAIAVPVVSVCVVRVVAGRRCLLMQRRTKPGENRYRGSWELPQGAIRRGETLVDAAVREVAEETSLRLVVESITIRPTVDAPNGEIEGCEPFLVVQADERGYVAILVFGEAIGEPVDSSEASGHTWMSAEQLQQLVESESRSVFPLNRPMLPRCVAHLKSGSSESRG